MSDRFDFLELGDSKHCVAPAAPASDSEEPSHAWKPLRLRSVEQIGEYGTRAGQFDAPAGIAVDPWGALYIADTNNHRIQRITPGGDVYVFGKPGDGIGQLWGPQSVAVDPTGRYFFVAEQGNNRVQCFQFTGQHQVMYTGFRAPTAVSFDPRGMLWVADTGASQALRIDTRTGECVGGLYKAIGMKRPIAVTCDRSGNIYISDGVANDVTRYRCDGAQGHVLAQIRRLNAPGQIAVDSMGRIFVAETGANRLIVLEPDGNALITFEAPSARLGPLKGPRGVAIGPNGEIYIADTLNHRIFRLAWD